MKWTDEARQKTSKRTADTNRGQRTSSAGGGGRRGSGAYRHWLFSGGNRSDVLRATGRPEQLLFKNARTEGRGKENWMVRHGKDSTPPASLPIWRDRKRYQNGRMDRESMTHTSDWDEDTLRTRHTLDATRKSRAKGREFSVAK